VRESVDPDEHGPVPGPDHASVRSRSAEGAFRDESVTAHSPFVRSEARAVIAIARCRAEPSLRFLNIENIRPLGLPWRAADSRPVNRIVHGWGGPSGGRRTSVHPEGLLQLSEGVTSDCCDLYRSHPHLVRLS